MAKAKNDKKNTADIGFEKQLWDAADVLRGNLDAAEYKKRRARSHFPEISIGSL